MPVRTSRRESYWRGEPLEVDAVFEGPWGWWAIEEAASTARVLATPWKEFLWSGPIGVIGEVLVLVVHTWPEPDPATGEEVGRIIGARKATARERRAYEEGES